MRPCVSVLLLATELTTHLLAALGGDKPIVGVVHSRHQEESTRPLPPFTETTLPPGDGAVSLAAWILRYGGNVSSAVSIKDVGGVRGGVTSEAMPEMKTVVKVPNELMLCASDLARVVKINRSEPYSGTLKMLGCDEEPIRSRLLLEYFFALERLRSRKSFWQPYIDSLPQDYRRTHPTYYSKHELREAQTSDFTQKLRCSILRHQLQFSALKTLLRQHVDHAGTRRALEGEVDQSRLEGVSLMLLPQAQNLSLDDFMWGKLAVLTRIFGIQRNQASNGIQHMNATSANETTDTCMVPYADLFNHDATPNMAWFFDPKSQAFRLVTNRPVEANGVLNDGYGSRSNYDLLEVYGFVLDDNEADVVSLELDPIDFSDRAWDRLKAGLHMLEGPSLLHHMAARRLLSLEPVNIGTYNIRFDPCAAKGKHMLNLPVNLHRFFDGFPNKLINSTFVQIVYESLYMVPPDGYRIAASEDFLDRQNWTHHIYKKKFWVGRGLRLLRNACARKILSYETTHIEDAAILKGDAVGPSLTHRQRNLVRLRSFEKQILIDCISLTALVVSKMPQPDNSTSIDTAVPTRLAARVYLRSGAAVLLLLAGLIGYMHIRRDRRQHALLPQTGQAAKGD